MGKPTRGSDREWADALTKSEEHLAAADALATAGNYAMAFSHVVLALEEWAKRGILRMVKLGVARYGTPDKVDPFRVRKRALINHEAKQTAGLASILLMLPLIERVKFVTQAQSEGRSLTREELEAKFLVDCQRSAKLASYIPRLEDLKQAGLYSGRKTSRGKIAICATQEEFEQFRAILAEMLDFASCRAVHPSTMAEIEKQREIIKDLKAKVPPYVLEALEASAASKHKQSR